MTRNNVLKAIRSLTRLAGFSELAYKVSLTTEAPPRGYSIWLERKSGLAKPVSVPDPDKEGASRTAWIEPPSVRRERILIGRGRTWADAFNRACSAVTRDGAFRGKVVS